MSDTESNETDLSVRVANEVAAAKGVDPTDLDPLAAFVDLESVDTLVANSTERIRIEWSLDGLHVEIDSDDGVRVW
jgi:hypothetical protein